MKKISFYKTASLIILFTAILICVSCGAKDATTMSLEKSEGSVEVNDSKGNVLDAMDAMKLYSGYGVGTQLESYAWINFDNVKLSKLDQESRIAIEKSGNKLSVDVQSGSMFFNITEPLKDDESMDIRTSTMICGIRGTCGWVTADGNTSSLSLIDGSVECIIVVDGVEETIVVNAKEVLIVIDNNGNITYEIIPLIFGDIPDFVQEEIVDEPFITNDTQTEEDTVMDSGDGIETLPDDGETGDSGFAGIPDSYIDVLEEISLFEMNPVFSSSVYQYNIPVNVYYVPARYVQPMNKSATSYGIYIYGTDEEETWRAGAETYIYEKFFYDTVETYGNYQMVVRTREVDTVLSDGRHITAYTVELYIQEVGANGGIKMTWSTPNLDNSELMDTIAQKNIDYVKEQLLSETNEAISGEEISFFDASGLYILENSGNADEMALDFLAYTDGSGGPLRIYLGQSTTLFSGEWMLGDDEYSFHDGVAYSAIDDNGNTVSFVLDAKAAGMTITTSNDGLKSIEGHYVLQERYETP